MRSIEKFIGSYKNTINLFGIIIALGVLIYSGISTHLAYKALTSDLKEYEEKNVPLFDFWISRTENKISSETISIKPRNQDISLNKVYFFFNYKNIKDTFEILIPENYKLRDFKKKINSELKDYYCDDCFAYSDFTCIPIGVKFQYFQFGKLNELLGLFKLTSKVHFNAGIFKVSLRHIEFLKYYSDKNTDIIWDDIELLSYENCYKKSYEHILIEKKKLEIILKDKEYTSIYNLIKILSKYYNYKIIDVSTGFEQEYTFNYFLGVDSVKTQYINLIDQSNYTYSNLTLKNNELATHYLKLVNYLNKLTLPPNTSFDTIINSQWVDKSINDSIINYKEILQKKLFESIKYAP